MFGQYLSILISGGWRHIIMTNDMTMVPVMIMMIFIIIIMNNIIITTVHTVDAYSA